MILYSYMDEAWVEVNDKGHLTNEGFFVNMTPESKEDCERVFMSREEFWKWYKS